jgi:hypothetical protein
LERKGSLELRANVISLSRHGNRTVCNSLALSPPYNLH